MDESIEQVNKCYKVVRVDHYRREWVSSNAPHGNIFTYRIGRVTASPRYPIFVFGELQAAIDYVAIDYAADDYDLLECECGSLTIVKTIIHSGHPEFFKDYWDSGCSAREEWKDWIRYPVTGTMVTPWVRPLKQVADPRLVEVARVKGEIR